MSKAITTSLYGGLGNQLFQYAAARALAFRRRAPLVFDLNWFGNIPSSGEVTSRKYALGPFALDVQLQYTGMPAQLMHSRQSIWRRTLRRYELSSNVVAYLEQSFRFDAELLVQQPPVWLHGHWQSPKYFSDVAEIIRTEIGSVGDLSEQSRLLHAQISSSDAICLHVRRGDYITNQNAAQFHGLCSLDYYRQGVQVVSAGLKKPHCYVFSDDPDWVRQNLDVGVDLTVVDVNGPDDAHQDLWLMAACKHFVIANSSLSWWGAWLCAYPGKKVVCPRRWFLDENVDVSDLCPGDWIRI